MSAGQYLAGVALMALTVGSLAAGAVAIRRQVLPAWEGAPARLAEATGTLAALIIVAQLLGAAGALHRIPLAAACAVIGASAWALAARLPRGPGEPVTMRARATRAELAAALLAAALVAFEWASRSVQSLNTGMADPDTLWYHMPFAARFAQTGSTLDLHYSHFEPNTAFYPANTELAHGIGISLLGGYDLLSPFMNLGFAGLALLGGWCVGRRFGVAAASTVGVATVLSAPIVLQTQPGQAANDAAGLAWLLAAAGLVACSGRRPAALVVAGLAAGMALGTKLTLLAPAGGLALAVLVSAARRGGRRPALAWGIALTAGGSFWYVRNLVRVGNPFPWYGLGPLHLPSPPMPQAKEEAQSVAHYATDLGFVRSVFIPRLHDSLGHLWPALVLLAVAGAVAALAARGDPVRRVLGVAAALGLVGYLVTPAGAGGAEGSAVLFGLNVRYAAAPLALGLALFPCAFAARPAGRSAALGAMGVLLVVTQWSEGLGPGGSAGWGLLLTLGVFAGGALLTVARRPAAVGVVGALALVAAGWPAQRHYFDNRYAHPGPSLTAASLWARNVHDARVGVAGHILQYPLFGRDTSNRVEWVGSHGPHGAFGRVGSCRAWRAALNAGHYRYVVTGAASSAFAVSTSRSAGEPAEARWTRSAAAATEILRDRIFLSSVFRIDRPLDADCG